MNRLPRDTFADDHLPPREQWPELDLSHPAYHFPERLNCVVELLDRWIERGHGDHRCLVTPEATWSYRDLYETVNRLANHLVNEMHLAPGNRVLLRAPNNPMMVAGYLAVIKAGGIAVGTMPMLRAGELSQIIDKAEISHALCDVRLDADLRTAAEASPSLKHYAFFGGGAGTIDAALAEQPAEFEAWDSAADETCLIAFTSGTTGMPKGTMHFHRDMLAICEGFSQQILRPGADDLFTGSPPIAFTFGLGGLVLFPLHAGAATLLLERAPPLKLLEHIERERASIVFTAPTAYRTMLTELDGRDLSCLRKAVSAGEHLPEATWHEVHKKLGLALIDGIGATEMLHIFVSAPVDAIRPGSTGLPVPGYTACILDDEGNEVSANTPGRLAVRGPTGCRYLADDRQSRYVQDGWNITGDTFRMDEDGYLWYVARSDDMIVSSGYNISGPEVENALLTHSAVAECAVIGVPDEVRGQLVKAFVVLAEDREADDGLVVALQEHVKRTIAPYKYPRAIAFLDALPRTATGKLQRYRLRDL
ncbi:AMP-binding protein [Arhodomonas sp. AD133]|uniref:AMP-binding protein n=1 Tax=Arhodomonas sp. AD133 TaxID=3415009 RepID=UPI003EBFFC9A